MFTLILLIILLTTIFCILLEFEDNTLFMRNCISSPVLFSFIFNLIIFFLIYYYQPDLLLVICGVLIIIKGFSYLGILNFKVLSGINHLTIHSFLAAVIISSSQLLLENSIFILAGFYFIFFISAPIINSIKINNTKSSELLTFSLELNRTITGMFMFIIGLVIAANRIPFLEKIAEKFF